MSSRDLCIDQWDAWQIRFDQSNALADLIPSMKIIHFACCCGTSDRTLTSDSLLYFQDCTTLYIEFKDQCASDGDEVNYIIRSRDANELPSQQTKDECSISEDASDDGIDPMPQFGSERPKQYRCEVCGKEYINATARDTHRATLHEKAQRYQCHECGKKFYSPRHFDGHMNVHFNLQPYECDGCGVKFAYKGNLLTHARKTCKKLLKQNCN